MKIAICFSGSIRDFPTCFPSLKKYVLNNLDADIFVHLWKMSDVSKLETDVNFKWRNDACTEQYVIDQLKPKRYVIDTYSDEWEEKIIKESRVSIQKFADEKSKNYGINACGMYYKIFMAYQLMENYCVETNTCYDVIIRARPDFIWEDHIHPNNFGDLNNNKVYLIKDRYATQTGLLTNDKFFAGTMPVMKKMCNIFNCISLYQTKGLMVEGQTLNENHIKFNGFEVGWIGHSHTYYKCMGRHSIKPSKKYILINNEKSMPNFWYELAYYLLYNNYAVIFMNNTGKDTYTDILLGFINFKIDDKIDTKAICLIGKTIYNIPNIKQIIINRPGAKQQSTECFAFWPVAGENITNICINQNIFTNELVDFIYSIISTGRYGGQYNFTNKSVVTEIAPGDKIIFKYMDHGYYLTTMVTFDAKKNTYNLLLGNDNVYGTRECLKIYDIIKYCDPKNPSTMPINKQRNDYPILCIPC